MSYATPQDLIDRYGRTELLQVAPAAGDPERIDEARVAIALADASERAEAHLRPRYTLPLPSVPVLLTGLGCDLARYRLMLGSDRMPTEQAAKAYAEALALLEQVAAHKADLGLDAQARPVPESTGARFAGPARPFAAGGLRSW